MENTVENMNENESIKVLVVDDEQDIRTLLNIYLKRLGYEVVEASDGVEAVETVSSRQLWHHDVHDYEIYITVGSDCLHRLNSV